MNKEKLDMIMEYLMEVENVGAIATRQTIAKHLDITERKASQFIMALEAIGRVELAGYKIKVVKE